MALMNPVHIAFIVLVALVFLGPKRLPELTRSLGSGMREFRESLSGSAHHDETATSDPAAPPATTPPAPPPSVGAATPPPPGPDAR
jgi:sec-independent protein translocase protein TatA